MSTITAAAEKAFTVSSRIARHATSDETKQAITALRSSTIPPGDILSLSPQKTFFITTPNIPGLRRIILHYKTLLLRLSAEKQGLDRIAIIQQCNEKIINKDLARMEKFINIMKNTNSWEPVKNLLAMVRMSPDKTVTYSRLSF